MRILVRNISSGEFLKRDGQWTNELEEGKAFERSYEAIKAASRFAGVDLEVVLCFDDPVFDIHIRLKSMEEAGPNPGSR